MQEFIQGIEGITSQNPSPVTAINGKFNDFVGVDRTGPGTNPDSTGHGAAYQKFIVTNELGGKTYPITTVLLHDIVVSKGVITSDDIVVVH
ncbi:MAG: hypothetical protein WDM89_22475 [Rhizomicrobium sp.]